MIGSRTDRRGGRTTPNRVRSAFLFLGALFGLAACSRSDRPMQASPPPVVYASTATRQKLPYPFSCSGTLRPRHSCLIRPLTSGTVVSIDVTEGARVSAGQVLVRIDDRLQTQRYNAAKAALAHACSVERARHREFERLERLHVSGSSPEAQVTDADELWKQAEADIATATAALRIAEVDWDNTTIKSPIAGLVGPMHVKTGYWVSAQDVDSVLTEVSDVETLDLYVRIPVGTYGELTRSRNVTELTISHGGCATTIAEPALSVIYSPQANPFSDVHLKVELPKLDPLFALAGNVSVGILALAREETVCIPEEGVVRTTSADLVYLLDANSNALRRRVALGVQFRGLIEITSGLKEGDRVLVGSYSNVHDKDRVRVLPSPTGLELTHLSR